MINEASEQLRNEALTFQKQFIDDEREKGDRHIYFFEGTNILGPDFDECTVDGVHPTDLGFLRIADALEPVVKGLILRDK